MVEEVKDIVRYFNCMTFNILIFVCKQFPNLFRNKVFTFTVLKFEIYNIYASLSLTDEPIFMFTNKENSRNIFLQKVRMYLVSLLFANINYLIVHSWVPSSIRRIIILRLDGHQQYDSFLWLAYYRVKGIDDIVFYRQINRKFL